MVAMVISDECISWQMTARHRLTDCSALFIGAFGKWHCRCRCEMPPLDIPCGRYGIHLAEKMANSIANDAERAQSDYLPLMK